MAPQTITMNENQLPTPSLPTLKQLQAASSTIISPAKGGGGAGGGLALRSNYQLPANKPLPLQQQPVNAAKPQPLQVHHQPKIVLPIQPQLQPQAQQPQQQIQKRESLNHHNHEPVVSRIPRLSLKFPLPLSSNNSNTVNGNNNNTTSNKNNGNYYKELTTLMEVDPPVAGKTNATVAEQAAPTIKPVVEEEEAEETEEELGEEVEDIDKSESRDALFLVCDIAKDIYQYMNDLEDVQTVRRDYLKDQKILTPKVRQRLIDWCIDIHSQLKLLPETLYMTIAVIDRYFDKVVVKQQSQVQLVAVSALLVAAKYEEIWPPEIDDLLYLTQNTYTRRDIIRCEIEILDQLNFDLGKPIPLAFLRRFSKVAKCDLKMHSIAKFLMEMSLSEYECSHWKPSLLAAAALFTTIHLLNKDTTDNESQRPTSSAAGATISIGGFSRRVVGLAQQQQQQQKNQPKGKQQDRWNKALVHYTHYTRQQLQEPSGTLCKVLKRVLKNPQSHFCVRKNASNLAKWPELKSSRVDELIAQCSN